MQLGHAIGVVHAELLPEDKAKIIKEFKREGPTAMIGDGLNDAPALATADIGISMGVSGSALATETGQVILLSNDIRKIPKAIKLARKATWKVIQNVILSITTKAAILILAIAGHPLVWAAVLADVGTCLLVILNSMLLLQESHNHGGKCCKSSSTPHVHKHGCNDGHREFSPHKDHQCCSNNKAPNVCKSEKCSSETRVLKCQSKKLILSSCCDNKCKNSDNLQGDCASSNRSRGAQHCHHGSCNSINHDLESQKTHDHGILGSQTCIRSCGEDNHHVTNSTERLGGSGEGDHDGVHDSKHCSHSVSSFAKSETPISTSGQIHSSCCGKRHNDNESHRKTVKPCCVLEPLKEHSCSKKHNKDHTTIDVTRDENHVESGSKHACAMSLERREVGRCCENRKDFSGSASMNSCVSLEKREMGGCCRSYMKECCSKHGHLGVALGGLSEVVID